MSTAGRFLARLLTPLCLFLAAPGTMAKVLFVKYPWKGVDQVAGSISLYSPSSYTRSIFATWSDQWLCLVTNSAAPGNFYVQNSASAINPYLSVGGLSSAAPAQYFNVDAQFATHDTVWIVPDAANPATVAPQILTTNPIVHPLTILLRAPFSSTPVLQVESQGWAAMNSGVGSNWWSINASDFSHLVLGIHDLYGSNYLGSTGLNSSSNTTLNLDSLANRNDTIWIFAPPGGTPVVSATAPPLQTVLLRNPWESSQPGKAPSYTLDGGATWKSMVPSSQGTPWWTLSMPAGGYVGIRDNAGNSNLTGYGYSYSTYQLNFDTAFSRNDTAWVVVPVDNPILALSAAPALRHATLMMRSPWDSSNPGQAPRCWIESPSGIPFAKARDGWWSLGLDFYGPSLVVQIGNATGTSYLSSSGLVAYAGNMVLDTALAKNDTIWLVPQPGRATSVSVAEPKPRSGVLLLLNPWEGNAPGLAPRMDVESQGPVPMVPVAQMPGWYAAPFTCWAQLVVQFLSNNRSESRGAYSLDTALVRNDSIWVTFQPSTSLLRAQSTPVSLQRRTLMFQSPWDSTGAPQFSVEGQAWNTMAPVAGAPGWYSGDMSYYQSLQVGFRDALRTEAIAPYGTVVTSGTGYVLNLDSIASRNDTLWVAASRSPAIAPRISAIAPMVRAYTVVLQNPWESANPGFPPYLATSGQGWLEFRPMAGMVGWYSVPVVTTGSTIEVQITNYYKTRSLYSYGTTSGTYTLVLDTALAKNDTIWLMGAGTGALQIRSEEPPKRVVTILFRSPWDTVPGALPGQYSIEAGPWKPFSAVAGAPGWWATTDTFLANLTLGIRDAKGTTYMGAYGTVSYSVTLTLDTAFARNDTVWIIGPPYYGNSLQILTQEPARRGLTVVVQSPWESSNPGVPPRMEIPGEPWKTLAPYPGQAGWYAAALDYYGSTVVSIRNAAATSWLGNYGVSSSISTLLLDTAAARNDTVWILTPAGSPKVYSVDPNPKPFTLILRNPWSQTHPGLVPMAQVEGGAWSNFVPWVEDTSWMTWSGSFVDHLQATIRLAMGAMYLGPDGLTSTFAGLDLDTAWQRNDTIWLDGGVGGRPAQVRTVNPSRAKVVMVFNPWDGIYPLQRPVALVGGSGAGQVLSPSLDHCGWYFLETTGFPSRISFQSSRTGESFGVDGLGAATAFDLSGFVGDTAWIAPAGSKGAASWVRPLKEGTCAVALLPATVRDFRYTNTTNSGLLSRQFKPDLGPDRKPVSSVFAQNLPLQGVWFRDSAGFNAATCRELVMRLDTATGVYRMRYPSFYPVDDFTILPGGGANPYNEKAASGYTNNYGFCLEAHGYFQHRRGQTDTIGGRDDIYQFLSNKMQADLGGTHTNMERALLLDTMGLPDDQVLPWDLFHCDRTTYGSALNWTMSGILAHRAFSFDSTWSGNTLRLRLSAVRGDGQGCQSKEVLVPTRAIVSVRGYFDTAWTVLGTGVRFGGIRGLDSTAVEIDTSALSGLPYGLNTLRIQAAADPTVRKEFVFEMPPPPGSLPFQPGARCDLLTAPLAGTKGCMNLSDLNGDTLRVSGNTTRLATEGLVLCGAPTTVVPGTDIAYLLDNSGSMNGSNGSDPTAQRGVILSQAIQMHQNSAPGSYAAFLPFESSFSSTILYQLDDPLQYSDLQSSINLGSGGGTSYSGALGWARVLLEGGKSTSVRQPSPNKNKAIILISDGRPSDDVQSLSVLLPNATTSYMGQTWTLPADSSVPVFGFMITTDANAQTYGKALYDLTVQSHGDFVVIPPNNPDSLRKAMMKVLGAIVSRARPDSLRIQNLTNGQRSIGLSGGREGGGFRFRLDSLVGLEPGVNNLALRGIFSTDRGDSVVDARWTVVVGDSAHEVPLNPRDSLLMYSCKAPTTLKIRPSIDSTRHLADERDASLTFWLDTKYDRRNDFPISFWTDRSKDSGQRTLTLAQPPPSVRAYPSLATFWSPQKVVVGDLAIQTGAGWDTVRAVFRMPRDRRDTAVAFLPVLRPLPTEVVLSPDTLRTASGRIKVRVTDPNAKGDTVVVRLLLRGRDTLDLPLVRDSASRFVAGVDIQQGTAPVRGDSVLQAGSWRPAVETDSVFAVYGSARDTGWLRRPSPVLHFADASWRRLDSLPRRKLQAGQSDTFRLALFLDTVRIPLADSVIARLPGGFEAFQSGAMPSTRWRLPTGGMILVVRASGPATETVLRFFHPKDPDSLVRAYDQDAFRMRFRDAAGLLVDSASVRADLGSDSLLWVEIWSGSGLCQTCSGWIQVQASRSDLSIQDSAGRKADSVKLAAGRALVRIRGMAAMDSARVDLRVPALGVRSFLAPVAFSPLRLRFRDGSGQLRDSASADLDLGADTLLAVEVWGGTGRCGSCTGRLAVASSDGRMRLSDSAGQALDSLQVTGGLAFLRIGSTAPFQGAQVRLEAVRWGILDTIAPVAVRPLRLRFVDAGGQVADHAAIEGDVLSDSLLVVEVWGRRGPCRSCDGRMGLAASDAAIRLRDSLGRVTDSVEVRGGRALVRIGSAAPVHAGTVWLAVPRWAAMDSVKPVAFRPYRLRLVDADGRFLDSLALDTLSRTALTVRVELWGVHGRTTLGAGLAVRMDGAGARLVDAAGNERSGATLVDGRAVLQVVAQGGARVRLEVSLDSLWASASVGPLSWHVPTPDSAGYFDADGDGVLDRVSVDFRQPWNPANRLELPWPDQVTILPLGRPLEVSSDSTHVEWRLDGWSSQVATAWKAGRLPGSFRGDSVSAPGAFPIHEHLAPVPLRAKLFRGNGQDTLRIWASEPLVDSLVQHDPSALASRVVPKNDIKALAARWDAAAGCAVLVLDGAAVDDLVRPADSVRFRRDGSARDGGLSVAGERARGVEVEGIDRGPVRAVVVDRDADGRAESVRLGFSTLPRVVDRFEFSWPDRSGRQVARSVAANSCRIDPATSSLDCPVEPWEYGATGCGPEHCVSLGRLGTARWPEPISQVFDLVDSVPPVPMKARLRLRSASEVPDTLIVAVSERVSAVAGGDWVRWGRPSEGSRGREFERLGQWPASDSTELVFLLDSSFQGGPGDSVRLSAWPEGEIGDGQGVRPGEVAPWVPLEVGPARPKLQAAAWPPKTVYTGWTVPSDQPSLSVYVRSGSNVPWKDVEGRAPGAPANRFVGVVVRANKALEGGVLHLYDNMGVSLADRDLSGLLEGIRAGRIETSLRGDLDAWIAWNGTDRLGRRVPSGVYLARLVAWTTVDGKRVMINKVFTLGWLDPYTPAPPPDLDFLPQFDWTQW